MNYVVAADILSYSFSSMSAALDWSDTLYMNGVGHQLYW